MIVRGETKNAERRYDVASPSVNRQHLDCSTIADTLIGTNSFDQECKKSSQEMGERYIFTIRQLTKTYNKKEILKDIWLAFYPGAKIGVIGPNGSGKSTLLRIMATED